MIGEWCVVMKPNGMIFFSRSAVFQKIFNLIPPIFIDFAFKIVYGKWQHIELFHRFIVAWILVVAGFVIVAVLDAINRIYDSYPIAKDRPIKSFRAGD